MFSPLNVKRHLIHLDSFLPTFMESLKIYKHMICTIATQILWPHKFEFYTFFSVSKYPSLSISSSSSSSFFYIFKYHLKSQNDIQIATEPFKIYHLNFLIYYMN